MRKDGSLDDLVLFQESEVGHILVQVVTLYLTALLSHGIAPNDAKPGNYLFRLEPKGRYHLVLTDYGITKCLEPKDADALKTNLKLNMDYLVDAYRAMERPANSRHMPEGSEGGLLLITLGKSALG